MKAVGVVVEYNPFHHGHALHIKKAKEMSEANVVIAAMSGNFLQRGEPALVSKWSRTKMALAAGVDIVFELPYPFATQKADTFAQGAISILTAAGCDCLCFGSESGDINEFYSTYSFMKQYDGAIQAKIRENMQLGNSYPKAVATAYQTVSANKHMVNLAEPNNMLGFQYLVAANEQNSPMEMMTIKRMHAHYHDQQFSSETIASATSIRKALFSGDGQLSTVKQYVPDTTYKQLLAYKQTYGQFHHWEHYWPLLQYQLIRSTPGQLHCIYEMEEGLENRFLATGKNARSFQQFMQQLKTRRYTWTRLQRAAVHILTNTRKEEIASYGKEASYLRLLGFSNEGRAYLNQMKRHFPLPLVSKLASFQTKEITLDVRAANIYALGLAPKYQQQLLKAEYRTPPIYVERN